MLTGTIWKDGLWKDVWKAIWKAPSSAAYHTDGVYLMIRISDELVYLKQVS